MNLSAFGLLLYLINYTHPLERMLKFYSEHNCPPISFKISYWLKLLVKNLKSFIIYPCLVAHSISTKLNLTNSYPLLKTVLFRPHLLWAASSNKFKVSQVPDKRFS